MKAIFKNGLKGLLIVPALLLGLTFVAQPASAGSCNIDLGGGVNCAKGDSQETDLFSGDGVFKTVTNILLFIVGAISVIMLIIGGIRYVISGGDQSAVTSAKNTILYAIVGIVVAFLAYAAVGFVLQQFGAKT